MKTLPNVSEEFRTKYRIKPNPSTKIGLAIFILRQFVSKQLVELAVFTCPTGILENSFSEGTKVFLGIVLTEVIKQRVVEGKMEGVDVVEVKCMCGMCSSKPCETVQ